MNAPQKTAAVAILAKTMPGRTRVPAKVAIRCLLT